KTYLSKYGGSISDAQQQQLWDDFNKNLNIERPRKPTDGPQMTLTLQGVDPQRIAQWANQYVGMAMNAAQSQLLQDLQSAVQLRLDGTQAQIDTLCEVALIDHQGHIAQIKEA